MPSSNAPYRLETHAGLPRIPAFASVREERLHRKQRLAAVFRIFAKFGFSDGVAGHVTVRDPEFPRTFWLNPFGVHFSHVKVSNLIRCDESGTVVEGHHPVNAAAFALHANVHKHHPEIVASAHTHAPMGRAWAALARQLDPINQDACAFYGSHALSDGYGGIPVEYRQGAVDTSNLGNHKALIMKNHGLLTVGRTVDEAAWWYIAMERCCQVQLLVEASVGGNRERIPLIPHDEAQSAHDIIGTPYAGWFNFQPLYQQIVQEQPDCLQ
ncbi:MAG: class II aldolase/adducin family protein [Lautropia sp.]